MAKRMKSKIQPAVYTLSFKTGTIPAADRNTGEPGKAEFYVDLSQCVSLVNRRFYRQGLNWAVSSIKIMSGGFQGKIQTQSLPNTWVTSNAWEKSFRAWQKMINNAVNDSQSNSIKGKFLDFKVHADQKHVQDGFGNNLLPIDAEANTYISGQWQPSTIEIPLTTSSPGSSTDFLLHVVGANTSDSKGLIVGYANSRALPSREDPNVPDDADNQSQNWIMTMFNEGNIQDSEVIEMLQETGDNPPYPFEGDVAGNTDTMYPGGETQAPTMQIHDLTSITTSTIGAESRISGGNFPCGLIKFLAANETDTSHGIRLQIELVPGNHRGYLAESMTEM